ncbi:MAG: carbohydrate porin [Proteobacteria bacterium]|nr:carbohydrate porin [Pseudomonadota bacterium]
MNPKILTTAIAAGLSLVSIGAYAQTAPTAANDANDLAQLQTQLASLQAKVAQLERQQAERAAQPAPSPDSASRLAALEKLVNDTRISGTAFIDFTHIDQNSGGKKTDASGSGLDVKRFYLAVDHRFNDVWSANLTTDFNYTAVTGQTQWFVKKAYLQGTFAQLATLRVGSANMAWIPFVEDWYGYRFVESTMVDRMKMGNSADWGAHVLGDNGVFNYQVSAVNGGGYKNPSRSNHVDFEARVGVQPIKGLMFAVGAYDGDLGKDTQTKPALHSARRFDALAAWNRDGLRLGLEWFRAEDWKNVTTPLADAASGWSAWGSYDFGRAAVFARYDRVKPSSDLDPRLTDRYYNLGVAFPITKGVRVALAWKNERLSDHAAIDTSTREIGAWAEVKF